MALSAAARLVVGVGRHEHITPALRDVLHWLPVSQRIQFNIAISAFDCVREHCSAYVNNVCIPVVGISGRANLRSAERHDMLVPLQRTQLGRRSFHDCFTLHLHVETTQVCNEVLLDSTDSLLHLLYD